MRNRMLWAGMALLVAAAPATAQQGRGPRAADRPMREARGPGIERNIDLALDRAAELGLEQEKIEQLREMRRRLHEVSGGIRDDARQLRQRARDADAEARAARRAEMAARREEAQALRDRHRALLLPFQEEYESLLSVEERARLRDLARGARPGRGGVVPVHHRRHRGLRPGAATRRGRAGGRRGPAAQGASAWRSAPAGQGVAPRTARLRQARAAWALRTGLIGPRLRGPGD